MEAKYSFSANEWQNTNVKLWADESFNTAKSSVYNGANPGQALSASYVSKNVVAIEKLVVVGGLRLAYTIQHIFGNGAEMPSIEAGEFDGFLQ
jgi:hypothetical protein